MVKLWWHESKARKLPILNVSSVHLAKISSYRYVSKTALVIASDEQQKQLITSVFFNKRSSPDGMVLPDNTIAFEVVSRENLARSTIWKLRILYYYIDVCLCNNSMHWYLFSGNRSERNFQIGQKNLAPLDIQFQHKMTSYL